MLRYMKIKTITKILIVFCIIGLSLLLYPSFSNYWNQKHATKSVNAYTKQLSNLNEEKANELWLDAIKYNEDLFASGKKYELPGELKEKYENMLSLSDDGLMGYVDIPSIGVTLPVFHGTSGNVLQRGVGHIEWTSLPTGGENTHCVLSGHRGLPSAKLFTDLNKLREGDIFTVTILGKVMTYEVDQIRTVLPNDTSDLLTVPGLDYSTLLTCTPYGINSHRLLVRGHRVATQAAGATVISEAVEVDQLVVAFFLGFPLVFVMVMVILLKKPKKKSVIIEEPS